MRGPNSILRSNERETDDLLIRAIWYAYGITAPLIGVVYIVIAKFGWPLYLEWVGLTGACLIVPTLFHRFRWLSGSVKYLGPMATVGALLSMSFTIHHAVTSWTVWLLPTAMAALYFQPRVVWLASGLSTAGALVTIYFLPKTFPAGGPSGLPYYLIILTVMQAMIAKLSGKAAGLLRRVEDESVARQTANQGLQAALDEVRHAAQRLVTAAGELQTDTDAARAFLEGDFTRTVSTVVSASRDQQQRVVEANAVMGELNQSIGHIAAGAQSDAAAVARGTGLVDSMAGAINNVSERAGTVLDASHRAAEVAAQGSEAVAQMVDGITQMHASTTVAAELISTLREHSQRVGGIADTIGEIAGQTNLLALNAAIEAARVGEQGKGFAVVAQEVRKLAERSASEARGIAALLEEIRQGIASTAEAVDTTAQVVSEGTGLATTASAALDEVLHTTRDTAEQVGSIAAETRQLATSAQELVESFHQINRVVEDNSAASEEMSAGSEQVLSVVAAIGQTSESSIAAVDGLEREAARVRDAVSRIAGVSRDLNSVVGRLEGLIRQA